MVHLHEFRFAVCPEARGDEAGTDGDDADAFFDVGFAHRFAEADDRVFAAAVETGEVVAADAGGGGHEDDGAGFALGEAGAHGYAGEFDGVFDVDLDGLGG